MTKNISEEELLLRKRARRRLLGAITLVIIAVIILPMIFDEPKQEQYEIDIRIPSEDMISDSTHLLLPTDELPIVDPYEEIDSIKRLPAESLDSPQGNKNFSEMLMEQEYAAIPIPGYKPLPDRNRTKIPVKNKTEVVAKNKEVGSVASEFVVQLGAFSDHAKAKQQLQQLVFNGIRAYTETIKIDNNEITRVRIGPFPTRGIAESELVKLKKLGMDGVITSR
ncbi:DedD protein [Nitrosomonas cryotolerans]|uniref:DedD protein n=1 Tax=Nitrosomonas cryotolerans ATCC 49181 TaxID=1131553 RepID=A0A1N6IFS5_9PROT|nr:SPOR domain-containing protein [Nitrosomonas cryotolerans]SFP81186.1 DedD protein [Nitrosomonas cryotolerans]SIO30877.1 DedD protein [Nitrosomonas cryotolerans ATCC 49181]